MRAALAGLEPRRRAVAVLRWLDERTEAETAEALAVPAEEVAADLEAAREALTAHGAHHPGGRAPSDDEARELLELVADEVPDVALAAPAWAAAGERRRTVRRRVALGGGVAVAGAVAAMVLTGGDEPPRVPRPSTSPSTADGRLPEVSVSGVRVLLAPDPQGEPLLPLYPDAPRLALSPRLGPGVDRPLQILSPAGSTASVRAVYLIQTGADAYRPALSLPRQTAQVQLVAMAPLRPTVLGRRDLGAEARAAHHRRGPAPARLRPARRRRRPRGALGPHAAASRSTTTGSSRPGGRPTAGPSWPAAPRTGGSSTPGPARSPGRAGRSTRAGPTSPWRPAGPRSGRSPGSGRITGARELTGPDLDAYGPSISNIEGWACRAAFFGAVPATRSRIQGLVAVQGDLRPTPRILAAAPTSDVPLGSYRPLAWGPRDTVALRVAVRGRGLPGPGHPGAGVGRHRGPALPGGRGRPCRSRDARGEQAFTGVWAL